MGKNRKLLPCMGLAFHEDWEMKKLGKLAKKGWILDSFKYLCYGLKKSEPEEVVFCVDYNEDKDDLEYYFDIFKESGWKHVCSYDSFHFFKAKEGTAPIYTDKDSLSSKYKRMYRDIKKSIKHMAIFTISVGLISKIMEYIDVTSKIYKNIDLIIYLIFRGSLGIFLVMIIGILFIRRKIIK